MTQSAQQRREEIQNMLAGMENDLIENVQGIDCRGCAENDEYCEFHQRYINTPRWLLSQLSEKDALLKEALNDLGEIASILNYEDSGSWQGVAEMKRSMASRLMKKFRSHLSQ